MPSVELSQLVSTDASTVWELLIDHGQWARVFSHLQRVSWQSLEHPSAELSLVDAAGHQWTEIASVDNERQILNLKLRADSRHPVHCVAMEWKVSEDGDKALVSLRCRFGQGLPIIGKILGQSTNIERQEQYAQRVLDEFIHHVLQAAWAYQDTVANILVRKGNNVISVTPETLIVDVCKTLQHHQIGAVLVMTPQRELFGLVSERDVTYELARQGTSILKQPASQIMTTDLIVCEPQSDVLFVMACMTDNKIRHLPVVDQGDLVGLISIGDVVRQRLKAMEAESDTLREYIATREWRYHRPHNISFVDSSVSSESSDN